MRIAVLLITVLLILGGCDEDRVPVPKPRMYPRVDLPERSYTDFDLDVCNFTFQRPTYATIKTGISFFGEEAKDACWFDLEIESLNTSIHFSYSPINKVTTFEKLVTDAFKIVEEHNSKAEYREEAIVENEYGVQGLMFSLEGPVASPINFFMTDTTSHFVRASLYFNAAVNPDSTKVVLDFVSQDINKIINTFQWKD